MCVGGGREGAGKREGGESKNMEVQGMGMKKPYQSGSSNPR